MCSLDTHLTHTRHTLDTHPYAADLTTMQSFSLEHKRKRKQQSVHCSQTCHTYTYDDIYADKYSDGFHTGTPSTPLTPHSPLHLSSPPPLPSNPSSLAARQHAAHVRVRVRVSVWAGYMYPPPHLSNYAWGH
jgi:hypothetical protein